MSARSAALAAAGLAAAALALFAALVPALPAIEVVGGDGAQYALMAEDPLEPVAPPPYAERIVVPLLVSALPLGTRNAFHLLAVVSMLLAAALVALIARHVALPPRAQVAAGFLTAGSYLGVHAVYNPYYVDPAALALTALALLLALRRQWLALAIALVAGVLVKEVAATLVVIPYLVERRPQQLWDARAALLAAAVAAPALVAFALVQALAPAATPLYDDLRTAFWGSGVAPRGVLVSTVGPLVGLFGAALLLWPLGFLRAPSVLRRLHVWALLAAPILVYGHWERTLAVFLPLVIPTALWALRNASALSFALFAAGSFWVTGVAGALTIGEGASSAAGKLALVAPGLALALAAAYRELRPPARPAGAAA